VAIRLYSSSANNLSENSIATNIHVGIMLEVYSPYNIISGNNITNNYDDGIRLYDSSNNIISGNNIRNNDDAGIYLYGSSYNTISGNDIENNGIGILIEGVWSVWGIIEPSDYNIISENNIKSNGIGIYLFSSSYNDISRNNIVINGDGILFYESFENGIYHNNIIDNWHQARTPYEGYYNRWDIGYPSGGNYWSDYTGVDLYSGLYQNETGSDGIGDTPYVIDAYNQDNYPLMKPWGMPSGMSANLVRRKAWPEHRHFVLSKDGNQTVEDRHGTPGYQTLYGIVENTGNITLPAGTYKVLWNITTETGYVKSVKTFGAVDLAPGELTTLTYDVPAQDLPPDKYYVKAQCYYYYAVEGERTKTFIFTVVP
jgi:parallel beta-helix repeat protein